MKLFIKIIMSTFALFVASYYLYFYISPSVTVMNKSALEVIEANVTLPTNNLNFDSINSGQENTIHYSLSQQDGAYKYSINLANETLSGTCGYLTNNEMNKRFVITINKNKRVSCSQ